MKNGGMDIQSLVVQFYTLEAMSCLLMSKELSNFEPFRHSHFRWRRDFDDYKTLFITKFSEALYDYTVLVLAGEMRHAINYATHSILEYEHYSSSSREGVYRECNVYTSESILTAAEKVFNPLYVNWESGYGGKKWHDIAKAGSLKDRLVPVAFIDHCVDLSHNNSVYFDKGAGVFILGSGTEYKCFLDNKRHWTPLELLNISDDVNYNSYKYMYSYNLKKLFSRMINLNIVNLSFTPILEAICSSPRSIGESSEANLLKYKKINWGNRVLTDTLIGTGIDIDCDGNVNNSERSRC